MGRMGNGRRSFSANPSDYKLLEEVGYGASATVYRAIYLPYNEVIAVKCLDLDRCNSNLDDIRKEAQTMSLIDHPNVVRAFCSFVVERCLWVVMPFMAEGSCLHLMKIAYPDGFEEYIISSILKETLKALEYLHRHGHIHRDVKAGNVLLDKNGVVKLGDFGVSACMFDKGDRQRTRNTFVGTPCWMAPEVLQPGNGYDFKADIWSFGITALELAHGHAPFSKYPPMKVLLMTIQNAPPGLDYDRDKKFSKSFKEMVAMCLVKDQTKRPTAAKLLKHSFFRNAKPPEISVKSLLTDLPPLWDRVKALQLKDAAQLALKKMPSAEEEALSQNEYKRGVSAWNFDVEDLKAQASLVQDEDDALGMKDEEDSYKLFVNNKDESSSGSSLRRFSSIDSIYCRVASGTEASQSECVIAKQCISEIERLDSDNPERNVLYGKNASINEPVLSASDKDVVGALPKSQTGISVPRRPDSSNQEKNVVYEKDNSSTEAVLSTLDKKVVGCQPKTQTGKTRQTQSGPLISNAVFAHSSSERRCVPERCETEIQPETEKGKRDVRRAPSFSGPLMLPNRASANSYSAPIGSSGGYRGSMEDKSKANMVQIKGRFSVTSGNLDLVKDIPLSTAPRRSSQPVNQSPKEVNNTVVPASVILPHLQNLFHQTSLQQDLIVNLLNNLQQPEVVDDHQTKLPPLPRTPENEPTNVEASVKASERERLLLLKISELQARMVNLNQEITLEKLRYIELQQQLIAASGRNEDDAIRREGDA